MILVAMETILVGNYNSFIYQNMCIYKIGWASLYNRQSVNHISLERAGHQHSDKVYVVSITSVRVELCVKMCKTNEKQFNT